MQMQMWVVCLGIMWEHPTQHLPINRKPRTRLFLPRTQTSRKCSHKVISLCPPPWVSCWLLGSYLFLFHSPLSLFSFLLCKKETNNSFSWTPMPSGSDLPPWASYPGILQDKGNFLFRERFWNEQLGKFIIHFVTPITKRSLHAFFKVAYLFICAVYGFFRITYTGNYRSWVPAFIMPPLVLVPSWLSASSTS